MVGHPLIAKPYTTYHIPISTLLFLYSLRKIFFRIVPEPSKFDDLSQMFQQRSVRVL